AWRACPSGGPGSGEVALWGDAVASIEKSAWVRLAVAWMRSAAVAASVASAWTSAASPWMNASKFRNGGEANGPRLSGNWRPFAGGGGAVATVAACGEAAASIVASDWVRVADAPTVRAVVAESVASACVRLPSILTGPPAIGGGCGYRSGVKNGPSRTGKSIARGSGGGAVAAVAVWGDAAAISVASA